jgi:hypothetical protein
MKTKILNLTILFLFLSFSFLGAQTIWTGPTLTFTKVDFEIGP